MEQILTPMYVLEVPFGTPAYDETVALRDRILRQPLGLQFKPEDFTTEYQDLHLACYDKQANLLGCLILSPKEKGQIKMRQVAVEAALQNKGIGKLLVEASETWARSEGFSEMLLHARDVAVPFYEKLAYTKKGRAFKEVGIKHYKMYKKL